MEILSGYKLRNTETLDSRNQVALKSDLLNAVLTEWDDGHFVYCLEDKTYYQLDKSGESSIETGKFKKFTSGQAIIDVNSLPTTNIKTDTFYRIYESGIYINGELKENAVATLYGSILDSSAVQVDSTKITVNGTDYNWEDVDLELYDDWLANDYVSQETSQQVDSVIFAYNQNGTIYFTALENVEIKNTYNLYHNVNGTTAGWKKVGGGSGSVDIDEKSITENSTGEIQANAVIPVETLPAGNDILPNSFYLTTETITYTEKEQTKTLILPKIWKYDSNKSKFISQSRFNLSVNQYDALSESQKGDGTLYAVVDDNNPNITWIYSNLDGKPTINGIVLDGTLTLEDIGTYSRTEINNLLAQKGNAKFVNALPDPMLPMYWYYSKKYADNTDVPESKRALYILDGDGNLQYLGLTGDVDLSNYYNKDESDAKYLSKQNFLNTIYPKGSIYITYDNTNPSTFLGGTWVLIGGQDANLNYYPAFAIATDTEGTTISESLPNATGSFGVDTGGQGQPEIGTATGPFRQGLITNKPYPEPAGTSTNPRGWTFDLSRVSNIYQNNAHVNVNAIKLFFWQRTDDAEVIFNIQALTVRQVIDESCGERDLASAKAIYDKISDLYEVKKIIMTGKTDDSGYFKKLSGAAFELPKGTVLLSARVCYPTEGQDTTFWNRVTQYGVKIIPFCNPSSSTYNLWSILLRSWDDANNYASLSNVKMEIAYV